MNAVITKKNMKIKVKQLDEETRGIIARALELYADYVYGQLPNVKKQYINIGQAVRHGELLLCEYVYPKQDELEDE